MSMNSQTVARFVTVTMGLVVGLTFLFGFGNVLNLALKLQVPAFVAPLVAPAVDLTVLGLLVGTRHLALSGASDDLLRPARHLLLSATLVTLLLNIADPVCSGEWGKAAFDSVGPLLLIGWAEAGPGLLRALSLANSEVGRQQPTRYPSVTPKGDSLKQEASDQVLQCGKQARQAGHGAENLDDELLDQARRADNEHWRRYGRPISAETLRKQLRVGAKTSRALVTVVRPECAPMRMISPEVETI
ncbi:hypothetical protein [Amycolatopsis thailandensis]|uniref:hypothetical protein n=1 Tax=Amycolatopsis thailandensis TaxID=589330 RepID=UPI00362DDEA3